MLHDDVIWTAGRSRVEQCPLSSAGSTSMTRTTLKSKMPSTLARARVLYKTPHPVEGRNPTRASYSRATNASYAS